MITPFWHYLGQPQKEFKLMHYRVLTSHAHLPIFRAHPKKRTNITDGLRP
jgi:hypothetical protein